MADPIIVQGPDGARIEFPSGTDPETITRVMRGHYGGPGAPKGAPQVPDDPIKAQVRKEFEDGGLKAGYGDLIANSATFGLANQATALLRTPIEMAKRGTWSPSEGYSYAKSLNDIRHEEARKRLGYGATAAEIAGGIGGAGTLAKAGVTAMPQMLGASLPRVMAGGAVDGAAMGALTGFNEGYGVSDSLGKAKDGALFGAAFGAAVPAALKGIGAVWNATQVGPAIVNNIKARLDPEGAAKAQMVQALMNSGKTAKQVEQEMFDAAGDKLGSFTLADALGKAGQGKMKVIGQSPGPGQQLVADALDARQAGQTGRLIAGVDEALGANGETAQQAIARLTAARKSAAGVNYEAARQGAGPVDIMGAVDAIDAAIPTGHIMGIVKDPIAANSVMKQVAYIRSLLAGAKGSQLVDFDRAFLAKLEMDGVIEGGGPAAAALYDARKALDKALEGASPGYAKARNTYRTMSKDLEAVDQGVTAAKRGRVEDTIPGFRALQPSAQQPFRTGYASPVIEALERAPKGQNAARTLTSDKFNAEINAFGASKDATDRLVRNLTRENTMFETRQKALGGASTFGNFAEADAFAKVDPSLIASLLHGNIGQAARQAIVMAQNAKGGNTAAVREELAKILLTKAGQPFDAAKLIRDLARRGTSDAEKRKLMIDALVGGTVEGLNPTPR